jgi:hypothetical protein
MRRPLAWALASFLIVGCSEPAGTSPSPPTATGSSGASAVPASPETTTEPTGPILPTTGPTGPSWTPRPAEALLLNSAVYVLVDKLNVREKPTVDSKSLGVVARGDFLLVDVYGPFSHDGYTWYPAVFVASAGEPPVVGVDLSRSDGIRGWIAVAKGTLNYVQQLRPRCPATIDTASMQSMLGSELLACFGSNTIELTGTFGCGGCGGTTPGSYEPIWLAHPMNYNYLSVYPVGDRLGQFVLHFPPTMGEAPVAGSVIRVRGHFDDAAAATCQISVIDPLHPDPEHLVTIPSEAAQLVCAQQFVVEAVEVLGIDPGFVLG